MFICSRKQVVKISDKFELFGLVNSINTNLLMVKICSVWEGIFSLKCVLIEFAIPNMSMIYFCI